MIPDRLREFRKPIPVLNAGHICLVDVMGDDQSIVRAARVTTGGVNKGLERDRRLIRYMMRHKHTSPFEFAEIVLFVRVPMDVWRQWSRHRTASIQEYSTRYSPAIENTEGTRPEQWRAQGSDNDDIDVISMVDREVLSDMEGGLHRVARGVYQELLAAGVTREQARKELPLCTYTDCFWKIDLHNLLHFLQLRLDAHAQYEIRQYAGVIAEIVSVWVPMVWEAFVDYRLEAVALSRLEQKALLSFANVDRDMVPGARKKRPWRDWGMSKGEFNEFIDKLQRCGMVHGSDG